MRNLNFHWFVGRVEGASIYQSTRVTLFAVIHAGFLFLTYNLAESEWITSIAEKKTPETARKFVVLLNESERERRESTNTATAIRLFGPTSFAASLGPLRRVRKTKEFEYANNKKIDLFDLIFEFVGLDGGSFRLIKYLLTLSLCPCGCFRLILYGFRQ